MQNALAGFEGYGWLMTIIIGGLAGWIAEKLTKSDMGLIMNILYGIVGGFIGNFLAGLVGFQFAGAVILISVIRMVKNRGAAA
jgi:uncharacterized membrane protein YeaQ/YmgE (transglycosylase-associated protein family)